MPSMVEPLHSKDAPYAAALLSRAFRDNPFMLATLDGEDAGVRARLLSRLSPLLLASYRRAGEAWLTRDERGRPAGVALVLPPGRYPLTARQQLALSFGVARDLPLRTVARLGVADTILRAQHLRGAHYYLFMLGVDPEHQGQGHGGALLRELCARADAEAVPCYLETDKPESVRLYERHGFVVRNERAFPRLHGLRAWFMLRPGSAR